MAAVPIRAEQWGIKLPPALERASAAAYRCGWAEKETRARREEKDREEGRGMRKL
jgi:hypothetical protein